MLLKGLPATTAAADAHGAHAAPALGVARHELAQGRGAAVCVLLKLQFKKRMVYCFCFSKFVDHLILVSIVVRIPACRAGDRGSIPRRGGTSFDS